MYGASSVLAIGGASFAVGYQGGPLKAPASVVGPGIGFNGTTLVITKSGALLDGVDLRGITVEVRANNVAITNSLADATGFNTIQQMGGYTGLVVAYCTFDGKKSKGPNASIIMNDSGSVTVVNNEFFNVPSDVVNTVGATIERNYFAAAGYQPGAHADAISIHKTVGPVVIRENYIDYVTPSDAAIPVTNAAIKIASVFGTISNVTVEGNVLLGGGYTVYAQSATYAASNIKISYNDIGLGKWGDLYPEAKPSNFTYAANDGSLATGGYSLTSAVVTTLQAPMAAAAQIALLQAASPQAAPPPSVSNGKYYGTEAKDILTGGDANEVFYGKGAFDVLKGGAGVDTLVGGKARDWLYGGEGDDIFQIRSLADSKRGADSDVIRDWGVGDDTISLGLIDANSIWSGNQAFKWIGTKPFSDKPGELHAYFSGSRTIVEGNVNDDHIADFQIVIMKRVTLTADDFYL
jgi:hypothetical protein